MRHLVTSICLAMTLAWGGCAATKGNLFSSKSKSTDKAKSGIAKNDEQKSVASKSEQQAELEELLASRKDAPVAFRGGSVGKPPKKPTPSSRDNPDQPFGDNSKLASNRPIRELMLAGEKYEKSQKWDLAVDAYESVLITESQHGDAHHRLGVIADRRQDYKLADQHYRVAMQKKPRDANLLSDIGYSHYLRGDLDRAEGYLKQAVEADPRHRFAHLNLGMVYGKQNRYEESLAMFQAVAPEEEVQRNMALLFPNGPSARNTNTQLADRGAPANRSNANTRMNDGGPATSSGLPEWANRGDGSNNPVSSNPTTSDSWTVSSPGTPAAAPNSPPGNNAWAGNEWGPNNATASTATPSSTGGNDFWQGGSPSGNAPARGSSQPPTSGLPNRGMAPSGAIAPAGHQVLTNAAGSPQDSMAARALGTPTHTDSATLAAELAMNSGWGNLFPSEVIHNNSSATGSGGSQGAGTVQNTAPLQAPVMTQQTTWPQAPGEYRDPTPGSWPAGGSGAGGAHSGAMPPNAGATGAGAMGAGGVNTAAGVWPSGSSASVNGTAWGGTQQMTQRPQQSGAMNQLPQINAGPSSQETFGQDENPSEKAPLFPSTQWGSPADIPWNSTTQPVAAGTNDRTRPAVEPAHYQSESRGTPPPSNTPTGNSPTGSSPTQWPHAPGASSANSNTRPTASLSVDGNSNMGGAPANSAGGPPPWPYGN